MYYTHIKLSDVRARLTELIAKVTEDGERIFIYRHRRKVAVIVSVEDWKRIEEDERDELYGPRHPETGRRPGTVWVQRTGWTLPRKRVAAEELAALPNKEDMLARLEEIMNKFPEVPPQPDETPLPEDAPACEAQPAPGRRRWWWPGRKATSSSRTS